MSPTLPDIIMPGVGGWHGDSQGLLSHLVRAPQWAAKNAGLTIPGQINRLIATKATHYALGEVTPRLWREAQPARRHPLVFCIVLDDMIFVTLCGTVVAECFHGKFVDAHSGCHLPCFPTDRKPVDNPAFAVGERLLIIPDDASPSRLKGRIVTEETFVQTKPNKYDKERLDRCSESGPRVSLANIIAADSAFDQLFGQFAFSIHQCEWYASVMRHLVAGRAPMSLSDQEVQDLLPPPGHNEVKATPTPSRSGSEKLVSDAEPQPRADSSPELKFMSPEQLVAAHARLKEVYDEKLLEVEQMIKQGYQDMLSMINSLGIAHYEKVIRSQDRTIESLERSVKVQNEYIATLEQATADSGKQIEMLRALLGQTEVGKVARSTPVEPSDIPSA